MRVKTQQMQNENGGANWLFLGILSSLMAITSLSVDIYLPALPIMHKTLNGDIELTITGFLIGFSIGQIIWGPISDRYGRRLPMALGLGMFVIGSIGCALSETIFQIVFWRVIQALGACTGPMLSRAMIRDLYGKTKAAEMLSTLMIVMAIAPIVGPLMGGQLLKMSSWHSIFWVLASVGVLMLFSIKLLPETLPIEKRQSASLFQAFSNYKVLLVNKRFMRYTLCVTFYYVGAYAFIAGSPYVYITYYGVEPQNYGFLFGVNIIGLMIISALNRKLVRKYSLDKLLRVSTGIAMFVAIILGILVKGDIGGIYSIIITIFFFFSMNGVIAASATAAALDDVPDMAGAASALLGSLQYGSGIISTILLAVLADGTPWTMSWIIALFGAASAAMVLLKPQK